MAELGRQGARGGADSCGSKQCVCMRSNMSARASDGAGREPLHLATMEGTGCHWTLGTRNISPHV